MFYIFEKIKLNKQQWEGILKVNTHNKNHKLNLIKYRIDNIITQRKGKEINPSNA